MAHPPDDLTALERALIGAVRQTYDRRPLDQAVRLGQRYVGATWINYFTRNIRHIHGLDRLPPLDPLKSYVCVCNHRSFFDLYVVTGYLVGRGMPHRLMFPVRSAFWYDRPLGLVVNGIMSFFAMYPPVFRERQRAALNVKTLDEVTRVLHMGGFFVGLHPEGRRNKDGDPYELLPAQSGVGRIIHSSRVQVLPVFINGLGNDLPAQIGGNITRKGAPIVVVFGAPVDFGEDLDKPPSPRVYRRIADRALAEVARLGQEERAIRAALPESERR
jgi:1-acyl-sn-glycerol-3-phosphate acyltransferase